MEELFERLLAFLKRKNKALYWIVRIIAIPILIALILVFVWGAAIGIEALKYRRSEDYSYRQMG